MSEEIAVAMTEEVEQPKPVSSIRNWKPADIIFTDDEKSNIALALGMPVEAVRWEMVENEIMGDVVGHSLVGSSF